jgi:ribose 5-phosphate isomerase B
MDEKIPITKIPKRIGIAADHGGFHLKDAITKVLLETGYEIVDFGNKEMVEGDDYPDYVIPLAQAVAQEEVDRGIAVCGSGVGACIAANKVKGVRACLITDTFSAHQGVEDDDMNLICLGGRITGQALAFEVIDNFLNAQFSSAERHRRRTSKVSALE